MNTTRFILEIVTSGKIEIDDEKNEMAQNIAEAIIIHNFSHCICPKMSDLRTEIVYVKEWYSDKQIIEHT